MALGKLGNPNAAWRRGRATAMARIPSVANGLVEIGAPGIRGVVVGSADWWAWLARDDVRSFAFRSAECHYTARKERRRRGGVYWVAYRMAGGRMHKAYLGKADELTSARLAQAATTLAAMVDAPAPTVAGATGEDLLLLATKLFAPRPRPDLVRRPRLLERLDGGLDATRCTLLAAPPGAGKTTLLAEWSSDLRRPVAWLALDARDQDPQQFVRYLIAAIQRVAPTCGRAALARLNAPPPPRTELILTSLINDLADLREPCVLILDDYHLVRSPGVHETLAFFVDHLPPAVHLVIATREDPPLALPRLRARGELTEVRAADLRFTADEATHFFVESLGLRLSNEQVATLVERTEGWAAGLQLAGLALRDRPDASAFVSAFAHGHRLVADYLTSEVLAHQPPSTQHFLLATSVLDRLCGPLCDAVLATDAAGNNGQRTVDSQAMLEELERANLFVIGLDDRQRWFRYHHLFADALRARLAREPEDLARSIHRRAGAWFGDQGLLPEAIQHALAGGDVQAAAGWIEMLSPTLLAAALAAVPDEVVRARPLLCVAQAWLNMHQYPAGPTEAWLDAADQAVAVSGPEDAHRARGAIAALRGFLATAGPAPALEQARTSAEEALANLPASDAGFRGLAGLAWAKVALTQGRLEQAAQAFADAGAEARGGGFDHIALVAISQHVGIERIRGARRRALAAATAALAWADDGSSPARPGVGIVSVLLSDLLREGNDLSAAMPLSIQGLRSLREYGEAPPLVLIASLSAIWLHLARQDTAAAAAIAAEARPLVTSGPHAALAPLLDAADAHVRLALGDAAAAVAWAAAAPPMPQAAAVGYGGHMIAAGLEAMSVTAPLILARQGWASGDRALLREATRRLEPAQELAAQQGLGWLGLKASIVRALIEDGLGQRQAALATLTSAVAQAKPGGYVRPFIEAGPPVAALLSALVRAQPDANVEALLAEFASDTTPTGGGKSGALVEPPSARELEVLRLLAAGRSNTEIAQALVLERSTVKTHLIHLYGKLGVHSRTQAAARARELQLLD
jgi:LuxR family transcriptional regulator, maltose regulon positive regulatory protein